MRRCCVVWVGLRRVRGRVDALRHGLRGRKGGRAASACVVAFEDRAGRVSTAGCVDCLYFNCACGFGKRRCLGKGEGSVGGVLRKPAFCDARVSSLCGRVVRGRSRDVENGKGMSHSFKASQHFILLGLLQVVHIGTHTHPNRQNHSNASKQRHMGCFTLPCPVVCGCRVGVVDSRVGLPAV